jgi:hypothetical protein
LCGCQKAPLIPQKREAFYLGLGFPFLVVSAAEAESISTKSLRIPKSSKGELFGYIIDIQWNE